MIIMIIVSNLFRIIRKNKLIRGKRLVSNKN